MTARAPSNNGIFKAILFGGLAVGVLDFLDATIFFGLRGLSFERLWQFVASGLIGRAAFTGGWKTVALGVFVHFCIATIIAAIYVLASRKLRFLVEKPVLWGLIYGIAAYFVMTYLVVPNSNAPQQAGGFVWASFLNGVIGHAFLVGLPAALCARKWAK